ncbi:zinc-dependent peptidase [Verrucomicrobiota bacterium]
MDPRLRAILFLLSIPFAILLYWFVISAVRKERRKKIMNLKFPDEWKSILQKNLPPYSKLTESVRRQLHGYINIFLAEKNFEGCGGLELNDEIRVTIAAQACMLLLNRKTRYYPRLRSVVVYPHTYVARGVNGQKSVRLGESWNAGIVVLAWDSVKNGAINFNDGHNVAFHEFAHQLDQEDGNADGAPILERFSCYASWARILSQEYRTLQKKSQRGKKSTMDRYGATNPAEFFAVATETFFEKPRQLSSKHPELYQELKHYYHLDPLEWEN